MMTDFIIIIIILRWTIILNSEVTMYISYSLKRFFLWSTKSCSQNVKLQNHLYLCLELNYGEYMMLDFFFWSEPFFQTLKGHPGYVLI